MDLIGFANGEKVMMEEKKSREWMVGLSLSVFLPMAVNLIVMFSYLLGVAE